MKDHLQRASKNVIDTEKRLAEIDKMIEESPIGRNKLLKLKAQGEELLKKCNETFQEIKARATTN